MWTGWRDYPGQIYTFIQCFIEIWAWSKFYVKNSSQIIFVSFTNKYSIHVTLIWTKWWWKNVQCGTELLYFCNWQMNILEEFTMFTSKLKNMEADRERNSGDEQQWTQDRTSNSTAFAQLITRIKIHPYILRLRLTNAILCDYHTKYQRKTKMKSHFCERYPTVSFQTTFFLIFFAFTLL